MSSYISKGQKNIWLPYTQMQNAPKQLEVTSAKGAKIKLKNGTELIDGVASWWSVAHGYNHPAITSQMSKQLKKLPHIMMAGFANQQTYKLAYNLAKITPKGLNKVFFSDSGSTAVEVAMKIAVQFYINKDNKNFNSKKTKFISFTNGYHGDTAGAMSLADTTKGMHRKFKTYLQKNYKTDLPTNKSQLDQFENFVAKHQSTTAGIIIEPLVQCAGGMKFHSPEILKAIYDIAKKYNIFFIADECATGFYRTGKYFACDHAKITPDIMVLGKALTGGFITLAATVVTNEIYNQFLNNDLESALMHGPTFMGNPLACSAANASLELFLKNNYEKKVKKISNILTKELERCRLLPIVKDVRVLGAIGVVEVNLKWEEILDLRRDFIKEGVWLRPFGNIIYIMPPLVIKEVELIQITNAIFKLLKTKSFEQL